MSTFPEVAAKVDALRRDLDGPALRKITTSVAVDAKRDVDHEVVRDLGPDRKMSGWGRFKFGSGFELLNDHTAELKPRPPGPWNVLEHGRKAKPAGQPKRGKRKVYRTPHGLRTATKAHPFRQGATRGHKTWSIATRTIAARTPERVHEHTQTAIARRFTRGS